MNGCHNREPFKDGQVLHGISSATGRPVRVFIPNRMNPGCQYTKTELGQRDPGCVGCKWKQELHEPGPFEVAFNKIFKEIGIK